MEGKDNVYWSIKEPIKKLEDKIKDITLAIYILTFIIIILATWLVIISW